ncbi:flagellar assembly peptidoglycan hydrolase FlgJ [Undibacterium sp. TJN25]|uniref:flagellar assembly peptidoglycan hydrolase FlgJ n=1 Tax=Undibacterium sp. TJN25 TaxID=3413056 RepID=UPI003BF30C43
MRQADFHTAPTPGLQQRLPATAPAIATAMATGSPAMPASGSNSFAALFGDVRRDVSDFIEHGSAASDSSAMSILSAEGQAHRARLQSGMQADSSTGADIPEGQQDFLESIAPWAQEAGQRLGVSADLVAAHAALESGWGQRPLRQSGGGDSNNLFALKAGGSWRGDVANSLTTEYENGSAVKKTEAFRSYPDQASAFKDYAQMLLNNPRYRAALNTGSDAHAFAQGLARGGYATDPAYADKLARVANRIQAGRGASTPSNGHSGD